MVNNKYDFSNFSDKELIGFYFYWIQELKKRNIIRTNNVVGEIGEFLALKHYNNTVGLPKLQAAPTSTKSMDAISNRGERYSIKTVTGKTTSVFYGIDDNISNKLFEYVIIVIMNKDYSINKILEITWNTFFKHKHWHSRMRAWNLIITKKLIEESKVIYKSN